MLVRKSGSPACIIKAVRDVDAAPIEKVVVDVGVEEVDIVPMLPLQPMESLSLAVVAFDEHEDAAHLQRASTHAALNMLQPRALRSISVHLDQLNLQASWATPTLPTLPAAISTARGISAALAAALATALAAALAAALQPAQGPHLS